jgi:hypothetical protein
MKKLSVKIVLAALVWVLSIAASLSGTNASTAYTMPEAFFLDFGEASINIIGHEKNTVDVSYTQRRAQQGLQGTLVRPTESSLVLRDYVPPVAQENPVAYRVDPWLPLVQFSSYLEPYLGLPEADYTIYVPQESTMDVRGGNVTVIGATLRGISAKRAVVTGSTLKDGFVAEVSSLVLRGGSAEGSIYVETAHAAIRDVSAADITLYALVASDAMDVEILDTSARNVVVEALDKPLFSITLSEVDFVSLSVGHSGPAVHSIIQNARIGQIYDNTKMGLSGR